MGLAEGVGTVFALEGSALAALLIAPLVERDLGLAAGEGTAFFRGLGPRIARRWADVQGRIDAWGRGCVSAEVDRAVWVAHSTFAIVGGAMAGALATAPDPAGQPPEGGQGARVERCRAGGIASRRPTARRAVKVPV